MKGIKMKTDKDYRMFLKQELRDYEKMTPLTTEERTNLRDWVNCGYSVHDNAYMAVYEGGRPMDFPDVFREEEKIRRVLNSLSYEQGSRYLLEEYGIDRDGVGEPAQLTYEELKEQASRLYRTCFLYWQFLSANGLSQEADEYVRGHIDEELPFESFDWNIEQ